MSEITSTGHAGPVSRYQFYECAECKGAYKASAKARRNSELCQKCAGVVTRAEAAVRAKGLRPHLNGLYKNDLDYRRRQLFQALQYRSRKAMVTCCSQQEYIALVTETLACYYCGEALDQNNIHVDHIVPLSSGGESHLGNLACACKWCNRAKADETEADFRAWLGRRQGAGVLS